MFNFIWIMKYVLSNTGYSEVALAALLSFVLNVLANYRGQQQKDAAAQVSIPTGNWLLLLQQQNNKSSSNA